MYIYVCIYKKYIRIIEELPNSLSTGDNPLAVGFFRGSPRIWRPIYDIGIKSLPKGSLPRLIGTIRDHCGLLGAY